VVQKYRSDLEVRLEELVKQSAEEAVAGAGKFAVALSGGSDSGLMVALTETENAITVKLPFGEMYDEFADARLTVRRLGIPNHLVVLPDHAEFDAAMRVAVPLVGRVTRHFSLFPLYKVFERLAEEGFDSLVFGDGPDESMCGYIRCVFLDHIYNAPRNIPTFSYYQGHFDKLPPPWEIYAKTMDRDPEEIRVLMEGESLIRGMGRVEMTLTRADVGGICDIFGEHFGIRILRPYMEPEVDRFMFELPDEMKIHNHWGKYLLRRVAAGYLPKKIVWRRRKMGGPVYPVNVLQGWLEKGEFNKDRYLEYQREILRSAS